MNSEESKFCDMANLLIAPTIKKKMFGKEKVCVVT